MFELVFVDRNGVDVKEGDLLRVDCGNGRNATIFFVELKYDEENELFHPFHTFSFHRFEKVNALPDGAIKCKEDRYNAWYVPTESIGTEQDHNDYLSDWRSCEHYLETRMFKIKRR